MKKIAIFTLYPHGLVPGPRFRYEQYLTSLQHTHLVQLFSFFNTNTYKKIHSDSVNWRFFPSLLFNYFKCIYYVLKSVNSDYVFIFREITPFGPPVFEWVLAKVLRKKIILDFDDAIWMSDEKVKWKVWLRYPQKTNLILKWAYKVSVGNSYLANYARQYNSKVCIIPTTIDAEGLHHTLKNQDSKKLVIGWTGSHSTLKYLDVLVSVIEKLEKKYDFEFLVICNKNPEYRLKSFRFRVWNKATEIDDLSTLNIGVMPLPDDEWSKGKCGFKALQYMALGIPAVVSPVGVNNDIVVNGVNGYLCSTEAEWETGLSMLLEASSLRKQMGEAGREKVVHHYSVTSNRQLYFELFK
jgi:glycosyltransferase involved in cell wall biosynthesis